MVLESSSRAHIDHSTLNEVYGIQINSFQPERPGVIRYDLLMFALTC